MQITLSFVCAGKLAFIGIGSLILSHNITQSVPISADKHQKSPGNQLDKRKEQNEERGGKIPSNNL